MSVLSQTSKNLGTTTGLGLILAGALFFQASALPAHAAGIGLFESSTDVGKIELKGSAEYLADKAQYRITGSGKNMWFTEDAFQFLSKKLSGDLVFSMEVGWEAKGKENHRSRAAACSCHQRHHHGLCVWPITI